MASARPPASAATGVEFTSEGLQDLIQTLVENRQTQWVQAVEAKRVETALESFLGPVPSSSSSTSEDAVALTFALQDLQSSMRLESDPRPSNPPLPDVQRPVPVCPADLATAPRNFEREDIEYWRQRRDRLAAQDRLHNVPIHLRSTPPPFPPTFAQQTQGADPDRDPQLDGVWASFFAQNLNGFHVQAMRVVLLDQIPQVVFNLCNLDTTITLQGHEVKFTLLYTNTRVVPGRPTPEDCHQYGIHFSCDVYVDAVMRSTQHPEIVEPGILLTSLPLMTGIDPLSHYDLENIFIVRGKPRCCPSTKTETLDFPLVLQQKDGVCVQVRSTHREKPTRAPSNLETYIRHSTRKPKTLGKIWCKMSFTTKPVHVAALAVALGCSVTHFVQLVRFFCPRNKYVASKFRAYELAILLDRVNEEEAFVAIAKMYDKEKRILGENQLHAECLPHLNHPDPRWERERKVLYLAQIVVLAILSYEKLIDIPLRDDFSLSQIFTAAHHSASLLRLVLQQHMLQSGKQWRKALQDLYEHSLEPSLSEVNVVAIVAAQRLKRSTFLAWSTGNWGDRKGVTMTLNTLNDDVIDVQLRRMSSGLAKTDGEHMQARNLRQDQWGFASPCDMPDGKETGLISQTAMSAAPTPPVHPDIQDALTRLLVRRAGKNVSSLHDFLTDPTRLRETPWMKPAQRLLMDASGGVSYLVHDAARFVRMFRALRRGHVVDRFTFIADNPATQQLMIICREGTLTRPLIVAERLRDITPTCSFEDCVRDGRIEYVCPQEQCTLTKVAMTPEDVDKPGVTHMEILQCALFGLQEGSIPEATAQQAPRLTLVCNQLRQVIHAVRRRSRGGVSGAHMVYASRPLCTTLTHALRQPEPLLNRGTTCDVLIALGESTQEDSVMCDMGFVQRGGLLAQTSSTYRSEVSTQMTNGVREEFERVPAGVLASKDVSYEAVGPHGLVPEGQHVKEPCAVVTAKTQTVARIPGLLDAHGMPIVAGASGSGSSGSSSTSSNSSNSSGGVSGGGATGSSSSGHGGVGGGGGGGISVSKRDISLTAKPGDIGQCVSSTISEQPGGKSSAVELIIHRSFGIADKCSTNSGNKSVCAALVPTVNMPMSTRTGMIPNLVVHPFGHITRQTVVLLNEGLVSKAVGLSGNFQYGVDEQRYHSDSRETRMALVGRVLAKYGFDPTGCEKFISGITGEEMEGFQLMVPVTIFRLMHIAAMKTHVRTTGRVDPVTRQPVDGRKRGGGGRTGEMEVSAFIAYGAAFIILQRFCDLSDGFDVYVCSQCHLLVDDAARDIDFAWCRRCGTTNTTHHIRLPHASHFLFFGLMSLGVYVEEMTIPRSQRIPRCPALRTAKPEELHLVDHLTLDAQGLPLDPDGAEE